MKIDMMPETNEQSIVVEDSLTIELRQVGNDHLEIKLVPHYENKVYFVIQHFNGQLFRIPLTEVNLEILNYVMEKKAVVG